MNSYSLPQGVTVLREEDDLKLLHYTDEAVHPSPADFYKGVVVDGNQVVARSFQWSPTIVTEAVSDDLLYSRFYEATVIRFYRHEGRPMVSTHRQIDISGKKSRVGTGRPFMELIDEAIKAWPFVQNEYPVYQEDENGEPIQVGKGLQFAPQTWQSLCVTGWCHVFLLVDKSNQITDLHDTTETFEVPNKEGELEVVSFSQPKLLHIISFNESTPEMFPVLGDIVYNVNADDEGYIQYHQMVPKVETYTSEQAEMLLRDGGAVVGFHPSTPDVTVKYFSPIYARKVEVVGETFNPIHRWHELMDENPNVASEYLDYLPWHMKTISLSDVQSTHLRYLEETSNYLADNIVQRVRGIAAPLDRSLYEQVKDFYPNILSQVRSFMNQRPMPSPKEVDRFTTQLVATTVEQLPYKKQHSIHGKIAKIKAGFI